MKAIALHQYGPPGDLQLEDLDTPSPGPGEVLVKVHATSINDWDWNLVRGKPFYMHLLCGLFKPKVRVPGVDVSGEVVALGEGVQRFRVGDGVYGDLSGSGFGAFAEFVCPPESALSPKPPGVPHRTAAVIPHAATLALQSLKDLGDAGPGKKLLINGAGGGFGTLGIQLARSMGVEEIHGIDSAEKLDLLRGLGFDQVFDYRVHDFTEHPETYDLIIDPRTSRSIRRCRRALRPGGAYVTVGGDSRWLLQAVLYQLLTRSPDKKRVRMLDLKINKDLDLISEQLERGELVPAIDGPYSREQTPQAIARFGSGKHLGKVLVEWIPEPAEMKSVEVRSPD